MLARSPGRSYPLAIVAIAVEVVLAILLITRLRRVELPARRTA